MPKPYHVTEYERQGEPRFDVGTHAFLTTEQARRMAHDILTAVTQAESAQQRERPRAEGSTAGDAS